MIKTGGKFINTGGDLYLNVDDYDWMRLRKGKLDSHIPMKDRKSG